MGDEENVSLLEQSVQFHAEKLKELEKETDQRFGKIDAKFERMEERQYKQETDINTVKSDVTFIKNTVGELAEDLKKKNEDELKQKNNQVLEIKQVMRRFFIGIAGSVIAAALIAAFGLK